MNPGRFHHLTNDKSTFARLLSEAGVPTPRTLAILGVGGESEPGIALQTRDEIAAWLCSTPLEGFFLKPVSAMGGFGTLSIGKRLDDAPSWRKHPGGEPIEVDGIVAHLTRFSHHMPFIVQPRLQSHPALAILAPNVLNTVRVVTLREEKVEIVSAAFRVALGEGPTDNFSQGGLTAPIELDSGVRGEATRLVGGFPVRYQTHPRSGERIQDLELPDWQAVLSVVRQAAAVISDLRCLGWDIGLTSEGPVILEANARFNTRVSQIALDRGLLSTRLGPALAKCGAYPNIGLGWSR